MTPYRPAPASLRRRRIRTRFDVHEGQERRRLVGSPDRELRRTLVERFIGRHLQRSGGRILEVGSGIGRFTPLWLKTGRPTVIYDISWPMLRATRKTARRAMPPTRQPLGYIRGAAEGFRPLRSGSFDLVALIGILGFLSQDVEKVLAAAHRVLRPDGTLLVEGVSPTGCFTEVFPRFPDHTAHYFLKRPDAFHIYRVLREGWQPFDPEHLAPWEFGFWRPERLTRIIESQGFRVVEQMAIAPLMGNQPELLRRLHRDRPVWANLVRLEEEAGHLPECLGVGAAYLIAGRRR